MTHQREQLLNDLERIVTEVSNLKKTIILEFKPSPNGKNKAVWEDLNKLIKKMSSLWDEISAVEEIKKQREK